MKLFKPEKINIFDDPIQNAQVAELVDALVSNTNVFGRAGSSPALGTKVLTYVRIFFIGCRLFICLVHIILIDKFAPLKNQRKSYDKRSKNIFRFK